MKTLFDLLSQSEKARCKVVKYSKDQILYHENDYCYEIGIVISGVISISSYSYQGVEMNYNTILPGGVFGNNLIFSSDPHHRGNVIAKLNSMVVIIRKEVLLSLLQSNREFLLKYLEIQSNFSKTLNMRIKMLSFIKAEDRLLYLLSVNNNIYKMNSVTALASYLNLSREATSRLLSKLKRENIISLNKNEIKLISL